MSFNIATAQGIFDNIVDIERIAALQQRVRRQKTVELRRNRKVNASGPVTTYYDKDADLRNFRFWGENEKSRIAQVRPDFHIPTDVRRRFDQIQSDIVFHDKMKNAGF